MLDFSELAPEGPRLLTRLEFEKLGQTDLFDDDERIELLRGVLVRMTPPVPSPRHDAVIHRLNRLCWCSPSVSGRGCACAARSRRAKTRRRFRTSPSSPR